MYSKLRFFCICFLFFSACATGNATDKKQPVNELQVLIDVSGSMKQNDSNNLRIPAVKLLINLLPEGTKVGLWLFAEKTTKLVETGTVNKRWRKNALAKVKKIHSRGLFTNIEDAIQNAAKEWFKSTEQKNRHLILLTDGMVDISKDIMQSAESRARIMSDQVPLLQQAGVIVQTIALSNEADAELLDKLAFDTQGWSETANSADQLQKVFFRIFKQAIPQDTVPIAGNYFSIDSAIKEFSVLIFKESGSEATQLIAPDKSKIDSKSKLEKVFWLNEKNYDLVTIKDPKEGQWKIVAAMDPENQVMIVTDLKFQLDEMPNHISLNESIDVTGFFTDQQQLISREDFLNLIDISVQVKDGEKWNMPAVIGKQGLFSVEIGKELKKGRYDLKIIADGKTFKREIAKTIEVKEGLVAMEKQVELAERRVTIKLIPDISVINVSMMAVEATISQSNKPSKAQAVEKKDGQWVLSIEAAGQGGRKIVNFSIMANTIQGDAISPNIAPVIIDDRLFDKEREATQLSEPVKDEDEKASPEKMEIERDEDGLDAEEVEEPEEPIDWIKTSAIVVGINILLIAIGFFWYKIMKKKSADNQEKLLSRLD